MFTLRFALLCALLAASSAEAGRLRSIDPAFQRAALASMTSGFARARAGTVVNDVLAPYRSRQREYA